MAGAVKVITYYCGHAKNRGDKFEICFSHDGTERKCSGYKKHGFFDQCAFFENDGRCSLKEQHRLADAKARR